MEQKPKKRFVFLLAVAVSLMFIISACQEGVVGGRGQKAKCTDNDGDGYGNGCAFELDCNDANPNINPGALEICDGLDNDCDGLVDESTKGKTGC